MKLNVRSVSAALRTPFVAGHGTVSERELLLVSLEAADGQTGHGEAAPLQSYDGVSVAEVAAALRACEPVLDAYRDAAPIADILARCGEATVLSQALAAIDMALWDLAGRRTREPVWRLLGQRGRRSSPSTGRSPPRTAQAPPARLPRPAPTASPR